MDPLERELIAAGGAGASPAATARLRQLLGDALSRGSAELERPRSGYADPVTVALGICEHELVAVLPAGASLRLDPSAAAERTWLLIAATVGALAELAEPGPFTGPQSLCLRAGDTPGGWLALGMPAPAPPAPADLDELAPIALHEHVAGIDRLRARALAVPSGVLEGIPARLRPPLGPAHPLHVAEALARVGGRPADPESLSEREDELLALLDDGRRAVVRPHEEPDRSRRIARRILQRLDGMGKWGGYHTEFAHLSRGFAGNERALAQAVGEALVDAGLLAQKPSVGQRHVYLDPRRAADIHRFIETGREPPGLLLPRA